MTLATLLVVHGPNRGTRFQVTSDEGAIVIGRSVGSQVRLDDSEVSRQHARIVPDGSGFRVVDLNSANGIRVNGQRTSDARLRNGDSIRLGATLLTFQLDQAEDTANASADQVQLVDDFLAEPQSAIVRQVRADSASSLALWSEQRGGLELLYQVAEELVRPVHTLESLLQRILELTLTAIRADRGCFLLKEAIGEELTPIAFQKRRPDQGAPDQMQISRSITGHVLKHGQAVRTSDALHDARFSGGNSIVASGTREAICAPMKGHEELLGVLYIDTTTIGGDGGVVLSGEHLNDEHLKAVLAVARQSALAVEARRHQEAFLKAERFAAMGQTIAVLSHHIKNILQGIRGGSYLIQTGLDQSREEQIRQGWGIVERNQNRIFDLVTDMLSFSKDRVPNLKPAQLNDVCGDIADLMALQAEERGVRFQFEPCENLPVAAFDEDGIHRAVLNIASNAIDAVEGTDGGAVVMQTGFDSRSDMMMVAVSDNGPGIPEEQRGTVFNLFESSKGSRGTGIGLPVSRKIIREHGGRISIEGAPGEGTRFVLCWPRGSVESQTAPFGSETIVPHGTGPAAD
ncbi:MAG: ATP-binding protein [Planctomycetaceae bacterium]